LPPQVLHNSYNHPRGRARLKKISHLELSSSRRLIARSFSFNFNGYLKPLWLLDPGGGFTSETAARRFQKRNVKKLIAVIYMQ
jgi:hypothetical protein